MKYKYYRKCVLHSNTFSLFILYVLGLYIHYIAVLPVHYIAIHSRYVFGLYTLHYIAVLPVQSLCVVVLELITNDVLQLRYIYIDVVHDTQGT